MKRPTTILTTLFVISLASGCIVDSETMQGETGPAGQDGDAGPQGASLWSQSDQDIYYDRGNVGIGTSPQAHLDVLSYDGSSAGLSSPPGIRVTAAEVGDVPRIMLDSTVNDAGREWNIFAANSQNGRFVITDGTANATERLVIDDLGHVGIGVPMPQASLDILTADGASAGVTSAPGIRIAATAEGQGARIMLDSTANSSGREWNLWAGNSSVNGRFAITDGGQGTPERLVIDASGNVGIGTSTPACTLDVAGTICDQNGPVGMNPTALSTRSSKHGITTLLTTDYADILASLSETDVVHFRYKTDDDTRPLRIGVIAEDAPKEIVTPDGKHVSLAEYSGYLLAAVKGQQHLITRQDKRLADLETRLGRLERSCGAGK